MKKRALILTIFAVLMMLFFTFSVDAAVCAVSAASRSAGRSSVKVLMYHKISNDPRDADNPFCISSAMFDEDIQFLKANGYAFCFASEVDDVLNGKMPCGKYVAVTFDDGYESDYYFAKPILEKYSAKATFFIVAGQIGTEDRITEEHLSALSKSEFAEIGSHSCNLHSMTVVEIGRMFNNGDVKLITDDFVKSSDVIERITGKKATVLSYPNGIYNLETDCALRALGFDATFTSDEKRSMYAKEPHGRINRWKEYTLAKLLAK